MSILEPYKLTHPELLSEFELKEVLENVGTRCIDFGHYKNLSRSELIELYKRIALPLPQRQHENYDNSYTKKHKDASDCVNELQKCFCSLNGTSTTKRCICELGKIQDSSCIRPKSPINEFKHISKKIRLCNISSIIKCNGINKQSVDEKQNGSSSKKRQKITWP